MTIRSQYRKQIWSVHIIELIIFRSTDVDARWLSNHIDYVPSTRCFTTVFALVLV